MNTAVIFDMDGVIVLTEQAHWESWQVVAEPRGVKLKYETFLSCFGRVNNDSIPILFGPQVTQVELNTIADHKERAFRDIIRNNMPIAPGLIALMQKLRTSGVKLAVGSSAPRENVELVLDAGKIRQYFDAVVDGDQVKRGKPAPDVFLLAAEKMKIAPEQCSVIEDAPAGIIAAVAAGMRAVAVATTHRADELLTAGALICAADLLALSMDNLLGH